MEREGENLHEDDNLSFVVQRYEEMILTNGSYFFDVDEFEDLIEFYVDKNQPGKRCASCSMTSTCGWV